MLLGRLLLLGNMEGETLVCFVAELSGRIECHTSDSEFLCKIVLFLPKGLEINVANLLAFLCVGDISGIEYNWISLSLS